LIKACPSTAFCTAALTDGVAPVFHGAAGALAAALEELDELRPSLAR
jgi:hypothetical protein